jgi:hypothetical protein
MTIPRPASVCEDWEIEDSEIRPASLVIELRKSSFILPWFRFVYAEGDASQIEIVFSTHIVSILGHGLGGLLNGISSQRLVRITQPTENEAKFRPGPVITSLKVEGIK